MSASLQGPTLPALEGQAVVQVPSSAWARTARSRTSGPRHVGGACGEGGLAVVRRRRCRRGTARSARGRRAAPAFRRAARRGASSGAARRRARRRRRTPARSPCRTSSTPTVGPRRYATRAPAIISAALAVSASTSVATGPRHRSTPGGSGARSVSSVPSRRFIGKSGGARNEEAQRVDGAVGGAAAVAAQVEHDAGEGPALARALAQEGAGQLVAEVVADVVDGDDDRVARRRTRPAPPAGRRRRRSPARWASPRRGRRRAMS